MFSFRTRSTSLHWMVLLLSLAMPMLAGCESGWSIFPVQPTSKTAALSEPASRFVTVRTMADHLDLRVRRLSPTMAMLHDDVNSVLITAPPDERINVNGQSINGTARVFNDVLYVTRTTMNGIKASLQRTATPSPAARPSQASDGAAARPTTGPLPRISGVVIVDPGHGGRDPGAPNAYGPPEKVIALDASVRLARLLETMGARVIMTREHDGYPTLDDRILLSNAIKPNLYISVHADSAANPQARGFTVYVARSASKQSIETASSVAHSLEAIGVPSRGVRRADFRVIKETNAPAILVELGYLTHAEESRLLGTAAYRASLAEAIARGIGASLP